MWSNFGRWANCTDPNEEKADLVQAAGDPSELEVGTCGVKGLIESGASDCGGECSANGAFVDPVADSGVAMPTKWAWRSVRIGVSRASILRWCVTEGVREHCLQVSSDITFSGVWVMVIAVRRGVMAMWVV